MSQSHNGNSISDELFNKVICVYAVIFIAIIISLLVVMYRQTNVFEKQSHKEKEVVFNEWENTRPGKTFMLNYSSYCFTLKKPEVDSDYNWENIAKGVMYKIANQSVSDVIKDDVIDSKDWAVTFMLLWYTEYKQNNRTCILVHNKNDTTGFECVMVAVWGYDSWICLVPQARNVNKWTPRKYWGDKYNLIWDNWNETQIIINSSELSSSIKSKLIKCISE